MVMARRVLCLGIALLWACGQGTGPELLPPYDGPLEAGQREWTGYQPGSVDIFDLVGIVGGFTGEEAVVIDMTTPGYYNSALGTTLDGTDPMFLPAGASTSVPIYATGEPSLAAASAILGPWLTSQTMPPAPTGTARWPSRRSGRCSTRPRSSTAS